MEAAKLLIQDIVNSAIRTKVKAMFLTFVGGGLFGVLSFLLGKYYG